MVIRALKSWAKSKVKSESEPPIMLKPILVNSTGRSGTTLLMQLLGTSPSIVIERRYPYEVRYLSYFLHWSVTLTKPAHPNEVWNVDKNSKPPEPDGFIGGFPYLTSRYWIGEELWSKFFRLAWQEFSKAAIFKTRENSKVQADPRYYAEKARLWVSEYLDQIDISYITILLVRDPRDVFLSINAFDEQRGFRGFNRTDEDTDWDYAQRFVQGWRNMHQQKQLTLPNNILVKYEDLVGNMDSEAERLGQWLDIKLNAAFVKEQETKFKHHMTSPSPEASIARWRSELSKDLNDFFVQELNEELRYFGYET